MNQTLSAPYMARCMRLVMEPMSKEGGETWTSSLLDKQTALEFTRAKADYGRIKLEDLENSANGPSHYGKSAFPKIWKAWV